MKNYKIVGEKLVGKSKKRRKVAEAFCIYCNKVFKTLESNMKKAKSCGCRRGASTHGMTKTRFYKCWGNMKSRCYNKRDVCFDIYGGRGIMVDEKWLTFENFYKDMYDSYEDHLTLDRIDNNKNYSKENCRWLTITEQGSNRRTNVKFRGETATQAGKRLGGSRTLVHARLRHGMSIEQAFTQPLQIHITK